jgi:hypothetical protein
VSEMLYRIGAILVRLSGKDFRCPTTYRNVPGAVQCQLPAGHGGMHRSNQANTNAVWLGNESAS